jgi:flagellar hook assembly protein FlgD
MRVIRNGKTVRSWSITRRTQGSVRWNGRTAAGALAPDGRYVLRVTVRDAAGNVTTKDAALRLDRTLGSVATSASRFYPHDDDALARSTRLTYRLARPATVSLRIYRGSTLVRTLFSGRQRPSGLYGSTWNGRDAAGAYLPRGQYTLRLTATSWAGTTVVNRPVLVDAFRTQLSATTRSAGQRLTVTVSPVEPLARAPRISLTQPGRSAVTKTAVLLASGRYRATFTIAAGSPGTARIRVTGTDRRGGSNRSYASLAVR